jgi:hypothetical protein
MIPGGIPPGTIIKAIPRMSGHNDLLIYFRSGLMVVIDFNHPSGTPYFMAINRRGERVPWDQIEPLAPRVFHFFHSSGYWCIVNWSRLVELAGGAQWVPLSAIQVPTASLSDVAADVSDAEWTRAMVAGNQQ